MGKDALTDQLFRLCIGFLAVFLSRMASPYLSVLCGESWIILFQCLKHLRFAEPIEDSAKLVSLIL
jgi:hypothetical protein